MLRCTTKLHPRRIKQSLDNVLIPQQLTISGMTFKDGNAGTSTGGAMYLQSGSLTYSARVTLVLCLFSSNEAGAGGGAIGVFGGNAGATLHVYTTTFESNIANGSGDAPLYRMTGFGNDIYAVSGGSVTVHSTCLPDFSGTPEAGSNLNTRACHIGCLYPGTILGTLKSFDLG